MEWNNYKLLIYFREIKVYVEYAHMAPLELHFPKEKFTNAVLCVQLKLNSGDLSYEIYKFLVVCCLQKFMALRRRRNIH